MSEVYLEVDGKRLTGFDSLRVAISLGAAAATCSFSGASFSAGVFSGAADVSVLIDGVTVFTGALDSIELAVDSDGSKFQASARSLTADLVDSTVDLEKVPAELRGTNVLDIVQVYQAALEPEAGTASRIPAAQSERLTRPPFPIAKHAPMQGESCWSAIERACRQAGVIATSHTGGGLEVISPERFEPLPAVLRQGKNVISARSRTNWAERWRTVIAEGQGDTLSSGWGEQLRVRGEAVDHAIRSTRRTVVQVEGVPTAEDCELRAQWETQVRAARGTTISVVTPGWFMPGTRRPWMPGGLVAAVLPAFSVAGRLLIDTVSLRFSDGGITAQLELVRGDAYLGRPEAPAAEDPSWDFVGGGA